MALYRDQYLGVKLTKGEDRALIQAARRKGLTKSSFARNILIEHLTAQGVLVYNPAPVVEESAQAQNG